MSVKLIEQRAWKKMARQALGFKCPRCEKVQAHPYQCQLCNFVALSDPSICKVFIQMKKDSVWVCPIFEEGGVVSEVSEAIKKASKKGFR